MTQHQMTIDEVLITDSTVRAEDEKRLSRLNLKVLAMLRIRPISNATLATFGLDYRGRIRDIRAYLQPRGQTVKCIRGTGGLNYYKIVELKE